MHVDGHALIMTSSQGVETLVDAIISPHMQEEMLVSWVDLQAMGRIPKGFPNQILGARRRRQKKKKTDSYELSASRKENIFTTIQKSGKFKRTQTTFTRQTHRRNPSKR